MFVNKNWKLTSFLKCLMTDKTITWLEKNKNAEKCIFKIITYFKLYLQAHREYCYKNGAFLTWKMKTIIYHLFMNNNMYLANMPVARIDGISGGNYICTYFELEIKPCGLGSKIWDMEADLIYWWTFRLLFIYFGKQMWHCGMDWTLS